MQRRKFLCAAAALVAAPVAAYYATLDDGTPVDVIVTPPSPHPVRAIDQPFVQPYDNVLINPSPAHWPLTTATRSDAWGQDLSWQFWPTVPRATDVIPQTNPPDFYLIRR